MTALIDLETSADFETSVLKNMALPPFKLISETISCPALTKADIGRGLVAGLCVAFIAIIADKIIVASSNRLKIKYGIM